MATVKDRFKKAAREVVSLAKRGEHAAARARLDGFLALGQGRWDYENKKAHVLSGMAYDALRQGEAEHAARYLEAHDRRLESAFLLPTMVDERRSMAALLNHVRGGGPLETCPRLPWAWKVAFVCPDNAFLSPLAVAWVGRLAGDEMTAISGGLTPAPASRMEERALREMGLDPAGHVPKRIPPEVLKRYPLVVGINVQREELPDGNLRRFEDWSLPPVSMRGKLAPLVEEVGRRVKDLLDRLLPGSPPRT